MSSPLNYALRLLKNRLKSAWEIDQVLAKRGVDEAARQEVIRQLFEIDLLNDERFALAWVHTRDRLAPRGEYVLRQELIKKGISKDIIDATLAKRRAEAKDEESDQPDEEALARELVESKQRLYANLAPDVRKRRLLGVLMRRGFSYDIAKRILES